MSTDFFTLRKITLCVRKENEARLNRDIRSIGLKRNISNEISTDKSYAMELNLTSFESNLDPELLAYNALEDIKALIKYAVIC